MANPNKIAGTCYVKVNAKVMTLGGTVTVSPSSVEREGKAGLSGVVGYVEKPRVPYIEVEAMTDPATKASDYDDITDATVTAELANGRVYILRNAWSTAASEINAAEGTFTKRFEGLSCDEI